MPDVRENLPATWTAIRLWKVLDSARLRVLQDRENLYVTDHYDGNPDELSGEASGEFVGPILGGILRALTDDQLHPDGDVM